MAAGNVQGTSGTPAPAKDNAAGAAIGPHASGAWYDGVPAEVLTDKVKAFKDVGELAKGYANLEKLVGRKGVILPTPDAKPEEIAEFRKALGVPEKPEEYDWKAPEGGALTLDDAAMADIKKAFHGANMTKEQFGKVLDYYATREATIMKQAQDSMLAEQTATVGKLKKEWGAEFDANLEKVRQVAKATGLGDVFRDAGVGNSEAAIKALLKVARHLPETELTGAKPADENSLRAELETIRRSPAFRDPTHPDHGRMISRREAIFKSLNPG